MRYSLVFAAVLVLILISVTADASVQADTANPAFNSRFAGVSLILFEFTGIPVIDQVMHRRKNLAIRNPFSRIGESEPYLEDKAWHFVGAAATTDFNTYILSEYLDIDHAPLAAGLLSLTLWTGMECMDALDEKGYFSLRDEAANILGTALGVLRAYYPALPLYMRIGVEDWGKMGNLAASGFDFKKIDYDHYSFMKAELIWIVWSDLYIGAAVSKTEKAKKDRFGVSIGYDLPGKILRESKESWWSRPLNFFRTHTVLSLGFTYWR